MVAPLTRVTRLPVPEALTCPGLTWVRVIPLMLRIAAPVASIRLLLVMAVVVRSSVCPLTLASTVPLLINDPVISPNPFMV